MFHLWRLRIRLRSFIRLHSDSRTHVSCWRLGHWVLCLSAATGALICAGSATNHLAKHALGHIEQTGPPRCTFISWLTRIESRQICLRSSLQLTAINLTQVVIAHLWKLPLHDAFLLALLVGSDAWHTEDFYTDLAFMAQRDRYFL